MFDIISSIAAVSALLATVYFFYRKENREDGQIALHRIVKIEADLAYQKAHHQDCHSKMEVELANQKTRQQGFQAEIENVADHGGRERQTIVDTFRREHEVLKDQLKDVPTMRELLYRMVERLETVKETNIKLDNKMDQIVVLLTRK